MRERRLSIRHIATSYDSPVIAVAEFERHVQTWNIVHRKRIGVFETTLDFGGHRLAVSRDGKSLVVGAWRDHGIALYDAAGGNEVWRRKDLNFVQTIRISKSDRYALCGFEETPFERLDLITGQTLESLRGVHDVWESPYDSVVVFDSRERDYKLMNEESELIATLPRQTFASLDFAFAPQKLCISESGGSVRCFNIASGEQLWEHAPEIGVHALGLAYNEFADEFAAILWPYEKGGPYQLKTFDSATGRARAAFLVPDAHEFAFCCKGSLLVTSDGKLRETATGDDCGVLTFFPPGTGSG